MHARARTQSSAMANVDEFVIGCECATCKDKNGFQCMYTDVLDIMDKSHQLIVTLALSVYLVFMFRHFRTTFTVHHPLEWSMQQRVGSYFKHPYGNTTYGRKICPFGQHAILVLVTFLLVRGYLHVYTHIDHTLLQRLSYIALAITGICSLLNMNAVVYLLPYFAHEYWWLNHSHTTNHAI